MSQPLPATSAAARRWPARPRRPPIQKAFGKELRRRVVEEGEPFAIVQADTPHEIFHAMDIPIITNQWWSAYISAKQLSGRYFDAHGGAGLSGQQLQILLAGPGLHAGQRSRNRALGRLAHARRCWSRG